MATTGSTPDEEKGPNGLPTQIGPYKILDVLGEGGMGVVYLADQKHPIHRRVALKVIKLGMDSKTILARFEAERQALAMMEHDCIARVFDAGATEQGQPYFVMELVKGISITQYCDRNKLGLRARLELLLHVCAAIQHAHHKGVIHRDLTPRNILVSLQDGVPMSKVIDFGLARATHQQLTEKTIYTQPGSILGTPEYMSPEQAGLDELDVDSRTDVYSLGVILYELLVGELPFPSTTLRAAGALEAQRVIREEEPPKPSTRLSGLGDASAESARLRSTNIVTLKKHLRGDLDWIVMKALEKDRTRRYGTTEALSDDLQRYLDGQPVLARPPSVGYRLTKLVRRYRVRFALAAALVVSLLGGIVATSVFALDAYEQRAAVSRQMDVVEDSNRRLQALGLAKAAMEEVHSDPTRAVLLALEAIDRGESLETVSALHHALAMCHGRRVFLRHKSWVSYAAAAPDQNRFVSGDKLGDVRLWDADGNLLWERKLRRQLWSERESVIAFVDFLGKEGDRIVAGTVGGELHLFDLQGKQLDTHVPDPPHRFFAGCVAPGDREQLALGFDGFAQVAVLAGRQRHRLERVGGNLELAGPVTQVAFSPDGKWLAAGQGMMFSAQGNGRGGLWRVDTPVPEPWGPLMSELREIRSLDFSDDSRRLLVGARGGFATVVDLEPPGRPRTVSGYRMGAFAFFLQQPGSSRQNRFVSIGVGNEWFWILELEGDLRLGPTYPPTTVSGWFGQAVSPARDRFAMGSDNGWVHVFDAEGQALATLKGHRSLVVGVRFLEQERIMTWGTDGVLRLWLLDDPDLLWRPGGRPAMRVQWTPDGRHLLTYSGGTSALWATSSLARKADPLLRFMNSRILPRQIVDIEGAIVVEQTNGRLAIAEHDDGSGEWTKASTHTSPDLMDDVWTVWRHDGRTEILRFSDDTGQGEFHDYHSGRTRTGPVLGDVRDLAVSPCGDRILVLDNSARVHLLEQRSDSWSLTAEQPKVPLATAAAFAPDGATLYVGSVEGKIFAFDRDGRPLTTGTPGKYLEFWGHEQRIVAIAVSRDALVASASADGTARLWHPGGEPIAILKGPVGPVNDCAFHPDGRQLWTAHDDGTVRKWLVDKEALIQAARQRISRGLTRDERERFKPFLVSPEDPAVGR